MRRVHWLQFSRSNNRSDCVFECQRLLQLQGFLSEPNLTRSLGELMTGRSDMPNVRTLHLKDSKTTLQVLAGFLFRTFPKQLSKYFIETDISMIKLAAKTAVVNLNFYLSPETSFENLTRFSMDTKKLSWFSYGQTIVLENLFTCSSFDWLVSLSDAGLKVHLEGATAGELEEEVLPKIPSIGYIHGIPSPDSPDELFEKVGSIHIVSADEKQILDLLERKKRFLEMGKNWILRDG
jgi:hypothetical protein